MGEVFAGRYELIDQIGLGGMGSIWRVRDLKTGGAVAAKVLRQSDAAAVLRFVREQAVRVHHPNIIVPLGWAADDDRVLFTMPVVAGGSVSSLIGDFGPLPPGFVAEVLRQVAEALAAVHAARLVHRDVKPSNILLEPTGTGRPHAFLTDFGIAVDLDGPRLTTAGAVPGTPGYLAPELLLLDDPTPSADVFALGRVGAAMLRGARPEVVDDQGRPDGCPTVLWDLIVDMCAPKAADRPGLDEVRSRLATPELAWTSEAIGEIEVFRHIAPLEDDTVVRAPAPPSPAPALRPAVVVPQPAPQAVAPSRPVAPVGAAGPSTAARVGRGGRGGVLLWLSLLAVVVGMALVIAGMVAG